jgi:hypothetical protein
MKKLLFLMTMLSMPLQVFCYQMTRTCNAWDVQNQVASLESWGCKVYSVRCENQSADMKDQRWTIVYDQN